MEMIAFKAAHMLIRNSRSNSVRNLPTPLQYSMALKLTTSPSLLSIWSYLRYLFSKHQRIPGLVKWLAFATIIQVALGTITAAADIWLHLTSTTQPWETVSPLQTVSTSYSRTLFENRTSGELVYKGEDIEPNDPYQAGRYYCATWRSASAVWLNGILEGLHTVNNLSTINTIYQSSDGIAFLGPAEPFSNVDFQATSYGIRSTCIFEYRD